jgi:hypothetical protein
VPIYSRVHPITHPLFHSRLTHSRVHPITHPLFHLRLTHSLTHSLTCPFTHAFIRSPIHSFTHDSFSIHSLTFPPILTSVQSFSHQSHWFIYSVMWIASYSEGTFWIPDTTHPISWEHVTKKRRGSSQTCRATHRSPVSLKSPTFVICSWFMSTLSAAQPMQRRMVGRWCLEGRGRDVIWSDISAFLCKNWERPRQTSVKITGVSSRRFHLVTFRREVRSAVAWAVLLGL